MGKGPLRLAWRSIGASVNVEALEGPERLQTPGGRQGSTSPASSLFLVGRVVVVNIAGPASRERRGFSNASRSTGDAL